MESVAAPLAGPLVLIVPGLPGTELGKGGEKLWFDPAATREGRLLDLAYAPGAPPLDTLGVLELVYLQLQLRLRMCGHDVAVHPFDWRRPVPELGRELAARIAAEPRPVHVVAHSMGGLLARAAVLSGAPNLGKVIMLGTPNAGTFSVVQGIRGQHWVLHLLSALDGRHTAADLASGAFGTWPSVYEQLPVRREASELDLHDPACWPEEGPRPDPALLAGAPAVAEWIAGSRGDFHMIAGYGLPTVDRVVRSSRGFEYLQTDGGDGWVPVGRVALDGYPCYYVRCGHIGMPNDDGVIAAVEDILARGQSDRLPRALPAPPQDLSPTSDDTSLEVLSGGRAGLGAAELAAALGQLVGPVLGALPGIAPDHTDWFTFVFWALRKSRLAPGEGFAASAIHPVRGQPPPAPGETGTVADALGPPMRVDLRYDSGADPLAPLPFGVIQADRLSGLLPVYDLPARWPSAADAARDLAGVFGHPPVASWSDVHEPGVLTRLATQGIGAHLLRRRSDGDGYEIDLLPLASYPVRAPFEPYGARLLLSADLAPEAIERGGATARPGDATWDRFVLAFEASLAMWVTVADHSLTAHFAMAGTFTLALRLGLPEGHALRDVLTPFTFGTVAVNSSGVYSLFAEQAYFTRMFGLSYEGLCALLADAAAKARWQTLPERLDAQGLTRDGAPALERLPFAADALLWWGAIDRFVAAILGRWADPADPAVATFVETWTALLPQARFSAESPRAALQRMLSTALFWITVMHKHVGDVLAYVEDPTWMPVKIRPGAASDQILVEHDAMQKMILGVLIAGVEMPLVLDDLASAFPDAEMARAWAAFQADLRAAGAEIASRNARRPYPYDTLAPEGIRISVSV